MEYAAKEYVTVYKVYRSGEGAKHAVYTQWDGVEVEFDGAEFGDRIIVEMGVFDTARNQGFAGF